MKWLNEIGVSIEGGRLFGPKGFDWKPELAQDWNVGGERVWLAPEELFNYDDHERIVETYRVEPSLDPAEWRYSNGVFSAEMDLPLTRGRRRLRVEVTRRILPLCHHRGYRQEVAVKADLPVVPWVIRQLSPGWTISVPQTQPSVGSTIFGTAPASAVERGMAWHVEFSGEGFFKTAYQALDLHAWPLTARRPGAALMWHLPRPEGAHFPEHLPGNSEATGIGLSLFYDSGRFGHYGEIEAYGHIEGDIGRLILDTIFLTGANVDEQIDRIQATEISSTPIS